MNVTRKAVEQWAFREWQKVHQPEEYQRAMEARQAEIDEYNRRNNDGDTDPE